MSSYIQLDAAEIQRQIESLFIEFPELAEDEQLRADVIEGEGFLDKIVERALSQKLEADMMVNAISVRMSELSTRSARFERQADAMRSLIKSLMITANLKKLPLPEATISIQAGRKSVNVIDLEALQQGYFTTKRQADKTAIKAALEAGEPVDGAELVTSPESLTIRTK